MGGFVSNAVSDVELHEIEKDGSPPAVAIAAERIDALIRAHSLIDPKIGPENMTLYLRPDETGEWLSRPPIARAWKNICEPVNEYRRQRTVLVPLTDDRTIRTTFDRVCPAK
jgi:hypothetical protein